jgi:hypothetical protein
VRRAFVEHKLEGEVALTEVLDDLERSVESAHLLVVAEGEVERAPGLEARRDQRLDGLEDAHHAHLVVQRAAAPHEPVGHVARERRVEPLGLSLRVHRHHIYIGVTHPN